MANLKRRSFLLGLGAAGFSYGSALARGDRLTDEQKYQLDEYLLANAERRSIAKIARTKGIIYGAFPDADFRKFEQDKLYKTAFARECALLVAGFYGVSTRYREDVFNYRSTDYFLNFAKQNKMLFRGHPLIWYNWNGEWLEDKFKNPNTTSQEIERILVEHVSKIVKNYAGQIHSWDVINEPINPVDGRPDGLRDTQVSGVRGEKFPTWLHFLGADYIDLAFRVAAEADSKALLVLNETFLEYDTKNEDARRKAVLNLLKKLKAKGTPIDALGIQAHLNASRNNQFNPPKYRRFLQDVASLGLKIMITELDVEDNKLPANIQIRDEMVARAYYQYLSVALDEPAVISVINWGLSDRYTWLSSFAPRQDGKSVRPLPLDRQLNRKRAWNAIAKALKEAPSR